MCSMDVADETEWSYRTTLRMALVRDHPHSKSVRQSRNRSLVHTRGGSETVEDELATSETFLT